VIENVVVLRDNHEIVAFGSSKMDSLASPNGTYRVQRPFAVEGFNPDLAEAVTRRFVLLRDERARDWIRWLFGRGTVSLQWAEWPLLSREERRSFLGRIGLTANVEVNGRSAVRGSWMRSLVGLGPTIREWAIE
jgi:hypothetical protein